MNNLLGIEDEDYLDELEDKIVKHKLSLLDYRMTFNCECLDIEFLIKLHRFLFGDLYPSSSLLLRYDENYIEEINELLYDLVSAIDYQIDFSDIKDIITKLYDMQLFRDGNHRTIDAFVKMVCKYYFDDDYEKRLMSYLEGERIKRLN